MQTRKTHLLHALLALSLTLSGCSGSASPAATTPGGTTGTGTTVTPVSTGNATLDSALNSTSDVRTALDGIRSLGGSTGPSATTQGFRVASLTVQDDNPNGTPSGAPPEFRDPNSGNGTRTEDRKQPVYDGQQVSQVTITVKIVDTQVGGKHTHQEFDNATGLLLHEHITEAQGDGTIKDTDTVFYTDPQGVIHKVIGVSIHAPFPPNFFNFDPNSPPPPPPDGSNQEFISKDGGKTFTLIGSGTTTNGVTTITAEFDDNRGVHIKNVSSSDPRNGKNSTQHFENGVLLFANSTERIVTNGKVLIHEVQDNIFIDPKGVKREHKNDITRLGDFFGGFVGQGPACGPAPQAPPQPGAPQPLGVQQVSSGGGQTTVPAPNPGTGDQPPAPGSGFRPPDPNCLPVPPGTIDALIQDFLADKLIHELKYHNDDPGNPKTAQIQETNVDPETGKALTPDTMTVNPDGTRTFVKHLPNGNVVTITVDPNLAGPPASVEKTADGRTVQKLERSGNSITITFYNPPGTPRHIVRGTLSGNNFGSFEEFDIRNGVEVKVAIGTVDSSGKVTRTAPDGTALNDDFGPASTQTKAIDADNDEQDTTQQIGGNNIVLKKKVRKQKNQGAGQVGSSGQFQAGSPIENDQVTSTQQVIGDGLATLDFGADITTVDKTTVTITFKSGSTFSGTITKGSGQAVLAGTLTTKDGKTFTGTITTTTGSLGLTATIDLTSSDGATEVTIDLSGNGTGVGTVKDLKANRAVFTISINGKGKATIRDANDKLVQDDVALLNKT